MTDDFKEPARVAAARDLEQQRIQAELSVDAVARDAHARIQEYQQHL